MSALFYDGHDKSRGINVSVLFHNSRRNLFWMEKRLNLCYDGTAWLFVHPCDLCMFLCIWLIYMHNLLEATATSEFAF